MLLQTIENASEAAFEQRRQRHIVDVLPHIVVPARESFDPRDRGLVDRAARAAGAQPQRLAAQVFSLWDDAGPTGLLGLAHRARPLVRNGNEGLAHGRYACYI